jgi:hypothetical protein
MMAKQRSQRRRRSSRSVRFVSGDNGRADSAEWRAISGCMDTPRICHILLGDVVRVNTAQDSAIDH